MPTHAETIEQLVARAERAEADLREVAEMLERHGRHDWQCAIHDEGTESLCAVCSCGYEEALRRAYAAADRVRP